MHRTTLHARTSHLRVRAAATRRIQHERLPPASLPRSRRSSNNSSSGLGAEGRKQGQKCHRRHRRHRIFVVILGGRVELGLQRHTAHAVRVVARRRFDSSSHGLCSAVSRAVASLGWHSTPANWSEQRSCKRLWKGTPECSTHRTSNRARESSGDNAMPTMMGANRETSFFLAQSARAP
jgi:hypothetical protein